jgi:drug/metabolite transporter (DMT)-like permease
VMTSLNRAAMSTVDTSAGGRALLLAPALFVLLYLIWGFTYVAIRIGLRFTGPLTMAGGRAVLAGLALAALAVALGRSAPTTFGIHRRLATVGLLNVTGLSD